jgi:hypothetical protein
MDAYLEMRVLGLALRVGLSKMLDQTLKNEKEKKKDVGLLPR